MSRTLYFGSSSEPAYNPPAPGVELPEVYRKRLPSGRNCGKRCEFSPDAVSSAVTRTVSPPAAGTRYSGLSVVGENRIVVPSGLQSPPRPTVASESVWAGPPPASIRFSLSDVKKASERLSGDQNG